MSVENMVDRVATALATAENEWDSSPKLDSGWGWENRERSRLLYLARAAIEAMREPTKCMVRHGESMARQTVGNSMSQSDGRVFADHTFRAVIDAALK